MNAAHGDGCCYFIQHIEEVSSPTTDVRTHNMTFSTRWLSSTYNYWKMAGGVYYAQKLQFSCFLPSGSVKMCTTVDKRLLKRLLALRIFWHRVEHIFCSFFKQKMFENRFLGTEILWKCSLYRTCLRSGEPAHHIHTTITRCLLLRNSFLVFLGV